MLRRNLSIAVVMVGLLLGSAASARAQGCIMCYESAAAASKGVQDALRNGVLMLLVPVAVLLLTFVGLVWRSARRQRALDRSVTPA
jgi:hypothetical protein